MVIFVLLVFVVCFGYFLFYGCVGDVYFLVIIFCVLLIFFSFMNLIVDVFYILFSVLFGGFNGISVVLLFNWLGFVGDFLIFEVIFSLCFLLFVVVYFVL